MRQKLNYIMISALCVLTFACGQAEQSYSSLNIVGGRTVTAKDLFARHVVALISTSGHHFCTGTLVGKQLVLTAAHCVTKVPPFVVGFGLNTDPKHMKRENIREVESVVRNREYVDTEGVVDNDEFEKGKFVSDVGFIKLKQPAPAGYIPAKLMPKTWDFKVGSPLILTGYGVTATPKPGVRLSRIEDRFDQDKIMDDNGILRAVGNLYAGRNQLGEIVVQSPQGEHGACSGDSGGPAFAPVKSTKSGQVLFYHVGVAARSNCLNSANYTDTRAHADWIIRANRFVNGRK